MSESTHISEIHRIGQCQRKLETILSHDMTEKEIVSNVLKETQAYIMPYKCFLMLEQWALREYGGESCQV